MRIFIDIETMPTVDPEIIADIRASIQPPGNYSKPDSIKAWMDTKGEQAALEAIGKTALSAEDGSIIAIGIATDDSDPRVLIRVPSADSDKNLLEAFYQAVHDLLTEASLARGDDPDRAIFTPEPWWVGHNITGFDLPFLWKRAVIHGITPMQSFALPAPGDLRHGRGCFDTMIAWAGLRGTISLSRLTRVLGLPDPKTNADGISGRNAFEFWERGDLETVRRYCAADVVAARAVFHRLEAAARRAA